MDKQGKKPRVVVLTGAGISAESGIQTFRDGNGLWENHDINDVATPEAFARNPHLVHQFYNARRSNLLAPEVKPNPAHYALCELEQFLGDSFLLVTQNIDNLHERAGSQRLIHMHGELLQMRSLADNRQLRWEVEVNDDSLSQHGYNYHTLRPDIVWFGEIPRDMDIIYSKLDSCDYFISVGTSGAVYPAANFVSVARVADAISYELNLETSETSDRFTHHIYGLASQVLPKFVQNFIAEHQ